MDAVHGSDLRRSIAGGSMLAAPLLLLVADAMQAPGSFELEWPLKMWLSLLAFIPAVLGLGWLGWLILTRPLAHWDRGLGYRSGPPEAEPEVRSE